MARLPNDPEYAAPGQTPQIVVVGGLNLDLVVQVRIQDMQLSPNDFEARVFAKTYDGHRIRDADWVTPVS